MADRLGGVVNIVSGPITGRAGVNNYLPQVFQCFLIKINELL